jgi:hypothetical protein
VDDGAVRTYFVRSLRLIGLVAKRPVHHSRRAMVAGAQRCGERPVQAFS